jgi:hypothetical protein
LAIFNVLASFDARLAALTALGAPKAGASIEAHSKAATDRSTTRTAFLRERMICSFPSNRPGTSHRDHERRYL